MTKVLRMSYVELKGYLIDKKVLLFMIFVLASIYLLPPYDIMESKTKISMLYLMPFIMAVTCSHILSKEFENKTYKVLFTGTLTRLQVIFYKLLVVLELSLLLALAYQVLLFLSNALQNKSFSLSMLGNGMMNSIPVFLVYALITGTFAMLVSVFTNKFAATFVLTYICFNDFIENIMGIVLDKTKNEVLRKIVENIPFTITAKGFFLQSYPVGHIMALLASSAVFIAVTCLVIEKRDLK